MWTSIVFSCTVLSMNQFQSIFNTYKFNSFNKIIAEVADSNISAISEKNEFETIKILFFKNYPKEFVEQVQTKNAIQNISKILT